jgi:hypothetical protein
MPHPNSPDLRQALQAMRSRVQPGRFQCSSLRAC